MDNKIDYARLEKLMQQKIETAQQVIAEIGNPTPDDVRICNLAIERMDMLTEDIEAAVFGQGFSIKELDASILGK